MCGRLTLSTPAQVVAEFFGLTSAPQLEPHFNIAPSQPVPVVRQRAETGARVLEMRRWGLVPFWTKDPRIGNRLINARAEGVAERPAFREAFRKRRCLVPADGFYEWQSRGRGPKQPYHVHPARDPLFAIAGLYERWQGPEGESIDSCTLVTTEANARMRAIHPRMPVLLDPEAWSSWLDPALEDPERLLPLLGPSSPETLTLHPVGLRVNDLRHDDPECIRAVPAPGLFPELF
jgi:putative SOS response-associated peptidase YedK